MAPCFSMSVFTPRWLQAACYHEVRPAYMKFWITCVSGLLWADSPTVTTASFSNCTGTDLCFSFLIYELQSTPPRTPLGRCDRVNEVWRRHGKPRVPEMTDDLVQIIASFCRQRGKLKTRLVFGVPPPLLSPRRIWFKGENQDGRRFRAGRKSWQLLRKVRKLAPEAQL